MIALFAAQRLLVKVARGLHLQRPVIVAQHEETAFRARELQDRVHHLIQHLLQVER